MSFLSAFFGGVILVLVLLRQVRVVPVPRLFQPRLQVFLGVIGLFSIFSYTGDHHVAVAAWFWLLGSVTVGALGLGALRGWSMRVWSGRGWVLRQGNALTMGLWLVSLVAHLVAGTLDGHAGTGGLLGAGFLLYLGVTLAVQYYVVHRRAQPLWEALGPQAGRPMHVRFGQGPGVFFTTFRTGAGTTPQWGGPGGGDIIDAEVVDDEGGPPELRAPR